MTASWTEDTLAVTAPREAARAREPDARPGSASLERGAVIGRHVVLGELGAGGMGVVYAAYDPELDRKVAIKLLLPGLSAGRGARERLVREAQAMARLSHPNVVAIHDVGEREGSVWLAMEFVEGVTLSAWLRAERRTWRAALEVMEAAGRGLAAAHAAGLLHRDFKPDNVMVGNDGRVRVMDLGLARASEDEPVPTVSHDLAARGESGKLAIRVTQAGAVLGTPAYMAPELFRGGDADARADVFAYCVTLWEALYGQRPFAGASMVRLAANVLAGKLEAPPRDPASRRVPRWLRRVCERGLALDPERRYASMPALLATFERGLGRARLGRSFAGIAALALVVGGALGWSRWDEHQRRAACERDGAEIDAVWNDARRRALREGLLATGVPYAATAAAKTSHYLDAQAKRWRAVRTGVCLETRVAGTWTEELLARASWCLEERKMELEALAAELTRANATTVQKAVMAAAGLNDVEPCRKGPRLRLLPGPPAEGSGVAAVDQELSHAGALLAAGDYQQGLVVAREALSRAEAVGWPPLVAKAQGVTGRLLERTGDFEGAEATLSRAYFGAARAGEWDVAADAATYLVFTVGYRLARNAEGRAWAEHAEVALSVLAEEERGLRRADLGNNLATLLILSGAYDEAKALFERTLAIRVEALGPEHPLLSSSLNNLANTYISMGANKEGKALLERALAIQEEALGPEHPLVATSLSNLATIYHDAEDYAQAVALHERVLKIWEKSLGPERPDIAGSLSNLGNVYTAMGAYEEAKETYARALAIAEKALGPEHPLVAYPLDGLAKVALAEARPADALPLAERALAVREAEGGAAEVIADSRFVLARALWDAPAAGGRDRARALAEARKVVEAYRAVGVARAKELAELEAWLAEREPD